MAWVKYIQAIKNSDEDMQIDNNTKRQKLEYTGILPIGKSSIEAVIKSGYYVDKTKHAETLFKEEATVFLSRPRRFGKSLFVSTLEEIAKGNKELFQDCYIYNSGYDWKKYPVIRVDFSKMDKNNSEILKESILNELYTISNSYEIEMEKPNKKTLPNTYLKDLINKLVSNYTELKKTNSSYEPKVVVLIDEYDASFINQSDPTIKEENRLIVREFLGVIKSLTSNNFIKLEFVTGVSAYCFKDCKSGPNNLKDITLSPRYSNIAGYREKEDLLQEGSPYYKRIKKLAEEKELDPETIVSYMRSKYNGYKFATPKNTVAVYNPWSTLRFLEEGILNNYWYNSGTPTFLTKRADDSYFNIDFRNIITTEYKLTSPKENELSMIGKMFQSGYLTIDKYEPPLNQGELPSDTKPLLVKFPNDEVEESFYNSLSEEIEQSLQSKLRKDEFLIPEKINKTLSNVDIDTFITVIKSLFSGIPFNLSQQDQNKNEAYYHTVLHAILECSDMDPQNENTTNQGKIDIVLNSLPYVTYILELKHNASADVAMDQIDNKSYKDKFLTKGKGIVAIGINFDSAKAKRNLVHHKYKFYDESGNEILDKDDFLDYIKNKKVRSRATRSQ
ncbi:AAA family ATPase [Cardinium endosymbiont of Culicoides punctatus]|uniref:AAA family ATPase n=1 Tax=Cardinium endosymbiont of Culicoides punctatus TaxID=2304601 RepID=UPI0010583DC9|nr:AAA family ATPase [Cardinium endosymbiont of Culicoides punctatus]